MHKPGIIAPERPILRVSAAILRRDGKVLAARRAPAKELAGYWEFPGGKIETGESPQECLARELFEEFSIKADIGHFVAESCFDDGEKVVQLLAYEACHTDGMFRLVDHDEIVWLAPEELSRLTWAPADIPIVEQLIKLAF